MKLRKLEEKQYVYKNKRILINQPQNAIFLQKKTSRGITNLHKEAKKPTQSFGVCIQTQEACDLNHLQNNHGARKLVVCHRG